MHAQPITVRDLRHGPQWIAGTATTLGTLTCAAAVPAPLVLRRKRPEAPREPSPSVVT
ncbi:hypothetical protein ACGFMK_02945 [Amycolatopsis sp. NPDC049252]|uniref:hypothetical protein n=1 Tax=Amycolatopsis sp. NPDC049252 TaxID=3363933 RepID=UPI00371D2869